MRARGRGPGGPIPAVAGIGLRSAHHESLVQERPAVGWIEAHTENYFQDGGPQLRALERARALYPLSLHGVGLGLGSAAPLDREHLRRVKRAIDRFEPALVSEHACWGHSGGEHFNDLLPLPQTEEALRHLASRVREVQDMLGRQILIENLSSYLAFTSSQLTEWEFLSALVEESGCGLAARRQQHLRQFGQSRAGPAAVHRRRAAGRGPGDPPRRPPAQAGRRPGPADRRPRFRRVSGRLAPASRRRCGVSGPYRR